MTYAQVRATPGIVLDIPQISRIATRLGVRKEKRARQGPIWLVPGRREARVVASPAALPAPNVLRGTVRAALVEIAAVEAKAHRRLAKMWRRVLEDLTQTKPESNGN